MPTEVIFETIVGEFRGNFPDVPIATGVNMDELKALDPEPFFITLPVIPQMGAVSKNGLLYDDALVASVEEQINQARPGGINGHISNKDRETAYPMPVGLWVGAKRIDNALWGKAYLPPGEFRNHVRQLKAVGGKIATSIYGKGDYAPTDRKGVQRLTNFSLESMDFAPPSRAALSNAIVPHVTREMETNEMDRNQIISELTVDDIPARLRDALVAEFRTQVSDRDQMITTLQATVAEFQRKQTEGAIDAKVAELTDWKVTGDTAKSTLDSFRRTLRSRIVQELAGDTSKLATVAETVWADLQPLAETVRDALAGPPAVVAGKDRKTTLPKFEVTPEATARARALVGF